MRGVRFSEFLNPSAVSKIIILEVSRLRRPIVAPSPSSESRASKEPGKTRILWILSICHTPVRFTPAGRV
jgi:hypothetical protein